MKTGQFIIFLSIVLLIYGTVNFYIFKHGWNALPHSFKYRIPYLSAFLVFASSFILGRIMERFWLCGVTKFIVYLGAFWLAAMAYFTLFIVLIDLIRLVNHAVPFIKQTGNLYPKLKLLAFVITSSFVLFIIFLGHLNATRPVIRTLPLTIEKSTPQKSLKMVMASDIHLGTIINRDRFCNIVNKINDQKPDIVLFVGDIVDEDLKPVINENLGDALERINSRYGTYAVTGNHEYIGGIEQAVAYLTNHGVKVLRDTVALIDNSFYIVGREDWSINRFSNKLRKPLDKILEEVDKSLPIIMMDHQPFKLQQAVANGVDLQLSGHTHHGQLWPFNYITKAIYELSWGYKQIQNTHFYVSCGVGTWGPPVRIGNRPEIVVFDLKFKKKMYQITLFSN